MIEAVLMRTAHQVVNKLGKGSPSHGDFSQSRQPHLIARHPAGLIALPYFERKDPTEAKYSNLVALSMQLLYLTGVACSESFFGTNAESDPSFCYSIYRA